MNRIFTMALKDLKLLFRDKLGAFFIVGFPILFGVFFGLMMSPSSSGKGKSKMAIAIVDQDDSEVSRSFVKSLQENDSVALTTDDFESAKTSVRKGQRVAMLVLEPGFGETAGVFWEAPPTIKIGADPSRTAESAMLQGFVMEAIGQLSTSRFQDTGQMKQFLDKSRAELDQDPSLSVTNRMLMNTLLGSVENMVTTIDELQSASEDGDAATTADQASAADGGFKFVNIESIDVTRESTGSKSLDLKSKWDISFPQAMMWGVLGCVAGFSISIARERSQGTMTRLQVAPVGRMEILLGKALACFLTVVLVVGLLTAVGVGLGMKPASYPLLLLAAVCVAFCFVGIMMVFSVLGKTEQSVSGAGWAVNMIMAMLGGCMIPVMFMPAMIQKFSVLSPIKWAIAALEGAIWRNFSLTEMLLPCAVLLCVGAVGLVIGTTVLSRAEG